MPENADFVLRPPVEWLNRIDDLLIHHGITKQHGSFLGTALAALIRSWAAPRDGSRTEPGPEHWGPRGTRLPMANPDDLLRGLAEATGNLDAFIHAQADALAERRVAAVEAAYESRLEVATASAEAIERRTQDLIAEFRRQISNLERQRNNALTALASIAAGARDGDLTLEDVHANAARAAGPRAMRDQEGGTRGA